MQSPFQETDVEKLHELYDSFPSMQTAVFWIEKIKKEMPFLDRETLLKNDHFQIVTRKIIDFYNDLIFLYKYYNVQDNRLLIHVRSSRLPNFLKNNEKAKKILDNICFYNDLHERFIILEQENNECEATYLSIYEFDDSCAKCSLGKFKFNITEFLLSDIYLS